MAEQEILDPRGEPKDVLVRGMGAALWEKIGQAAKRNLMTNAEFLMAHFERHGIDGQAFIIAKPPAVITAKPNDDSAAALVGTLAEAAVSLNQINALEAPTTVAINRLIRRLSKPVKQAP